ncbi:MAG: zf-HC2 domain-containing protein, partial [Myxococcota bacterium]
MRAPCVYIHAFVDGELDGKQSADFRHHLGTCGTCQNELRELLLLASIEESFIKSTHVVMPGPVNVAEGSGPTTAEPLSDEDIPEVDPALWSQRSYWWRSPTPIMSAAVLILLCLVLPQRVGKQSSADDTGLQSNLDWHRYIEGRLTYGAAAQHRAYNQMRNRTARYEAIPPTVESRLYNSHDWHGLATVALLTGRRLDAASDALDRAAPSVAVTSDRAVIQLLERNPEDALQYTAQVLAEAPEHGPALWNRALALRALGLSLSAASTFSQVAALGEPGWSGEARERAAVLRDRMMRSRDRFRSAQVHADEIERGARDFDFG